MCDVWFDNSLTWNFVLNEDLIQEDSNVTIDINEKLKELFRMGKDFIPKVESNGSGRRTKKIKSISKNVEKEKAKELVDPNMTPS